jgi:NUMOD3 motif
LGNGTLVNMTDGGGGLYNPSEDIKRKLSLAAKYYHSKVDKTTYVNPMKGKFGENNPNYGRRNSPEVLAKMKIAKQNISLETRRKMSDAQQNKKISDETRRKMSESLKGKSRPMEVVDKIAIANKKPVACFTLDGQFVKRYESAVDAERIDGYSRCHITSCCKGKRNSTGGFKWKYYEE